MLEILVEDFTPPLDIRCINGKLKHGYGWDAGNRTFWSKKLRDQTCTATRVAEYYPKVDHTPVYLVTVPEIEGFFKTDWITALPEATVERLIKFNIPILLSQPDEYFVRYDQEQIERFDRTLSERGLGTNTVFTHSINISYDQNQTIAVGQRQIINFFSYGWLNTASINSVAADTTVNRDRDYICINRTMRDIRGLFYLNYIDRQDSAYVSFIAEYGGKPLSVQHMQYKFNIALQYVSEDFRNKLMPHIDSATASLPKFLDSEKNQAVKGISNSDLESLRKKVWFEIVTETHDIDYDNTDIAILTEKTLFPIAAGLPFIVLGHKKIYRLLDELGFQRYDFDYDPDCNLTERFGQLNRFLDRFKSWTGEEKAQWFAEQQSRIAHNQQLLASVKWITLESSLLEQRILSGVDSSA